ncbi:fructose bisphosphate aldolase [Komagataeibacter nataicola]|uniref:fructose-bisphosphate aldolase n=1 Tax=Komagataeibacter nataicola TaxID=265960 RepID=A0A9N7CFU4_9PROT|nr:fructose bisphosphate aldolase [Komagataeibacter nataicola]AQU88629.1 fructose bisphosphate aldolase [Komagataeibacter nataicola]PYD64989.1 fructose bisphosphate aldolase [Komagataeibacter nataicola]WEQ57125.1 fructose bisphosphate aldolase [Komagataeibacter nataicola]WNM08666.1 fructose bisphosphate aldolase [Komagataeibacter nataicola]GBR21278.1 fructose-1,6-bisphosphate aldolase [Komagataeibacter nataicola NRIC 0616]
MPVEQMRKNMSENAGFIAALDQSGGSTPGALRHYGIPDSAYSTDSQMFALMHEMRVRVITAPAFTGKKILAAILFEQTMNGLVKDTPVPAYLWQEKGVVPFLKVDKGLEPEAGGVQVMKPIPTLEAMLDQAVSKGIYGTKARSVIRLAEREGIAAIVKQQFTLAEQVAARGLVPIMEPEVLIKSPDKAGAEALLHDELHRGLDALPGDYQVMIKVSIPEKADLYLDLIKHPRVQRVVALSGGYPRDEACQRLAANHGMIASFSRALLEDLRYTMTDAEFDAALAKAIEQIFKASTQKG